MGFYFTGGPPPITVEDQVRTADAIRDGMFVYFEREGPGSVVLRAMPEVSIVPPGMNVYRVKLEENGDVNFVLS